MRIWTALLLLAACGGSDAFTGKPAAPSKNDTDYFAVQHKGWTVVGNKATPNETTLSIVVEAADADRIDAWVHDLAPVRLEEQPDGKFKGDVVIGDLAVGTYDVILQADQKSTGFWKTSFHRSAPYYVIVTTDWDFSDQGVKAGEYQDMMHANHPELVMTHFVGPYTFTDTAVTATRRQEIVAWLLKMRDTHKDEIGLHIHPYCHFVQSAGVTCITDQSTVYANGDTTGYTIKLSAYTRAQMGTLLDHANFLFEQNGLNRTKTFRAGGWTASLETVQALADKGFTADTSALNWARIEEWKDQQNGELYRWNMSNWTPIGDTSQPYFPSETNVLTSDAPTLSILEVPDNGVMIDYVSLAEMNGLFDANWDGNPLASPRTLMMGFHPSSGFNSSEFGRVDGFMKYVDEHLAARGLGPAVYITLENVVAAYKP